MMLLTLILFAGLGKPQPTFNRDVTVEITRQEVVANDSKAVKRKVEYALNWYKSKYGIDFRKAFDHEFGHQGEWMSSPYWDELWRLDEQIGIKTDKTRAVFRFDRRTKKVRLTVL
jgi:hypothetical protein